MASDKLVQLGKRVGQVQGEIGHATRDFSKNLSVIEKSNDLLGSLYTFKFEFKTYDIEHRTAYLSLQFFEKFQWQIQEHADNDG